jgi:hypothetical protein
MSLDFDRSPDGEPLPPATQQPVPVQQAPATTEQESPAAPSFTPKHAAGELEPDAYEPGPAAGEPTASRPVVSGSVVNEPVTAGPADDELTDHELAEDELPDDELPDDVLPAAEAVTAAATASEGTAYHSSVAPAWDAADGLDGPLLRDADELHVSWQRIQGAFIDDPREAVADAAGLIEHVGQLLAGADRPAADGGPDTEQLRLLIRRYRALFNELCRP